MSNTNKNENTLSSILEINDFLNQLFDKLLITPEPKGQYSERKSNDSPQMKSQSPIKNKETVKETNAAEDEELCIICLEHKVSHACIPCGHLKYCERCVKIVVDRNECAVCRSKVQSVYKIFT